MPIYFYNLNIICYYNPQCYVGGYVKREIIRLKQNLFGKFCSVCCLQVHLINMSYFVVSGNGKWLSKCINYKKTIYIWLYPFLFCNLAQSLLSINRNGRISRSEGKTEGLTGGFTSNMVRLYIRYILIVITCSHSVYLNFIL